MKLFNINTKGELTEADNLLEVFHIDTNMKQTIAFIGAGGKTNSMFQLAVDLTNLGKKVIITTTTKMHLSRKFGVLDEDRYKLIDMLEEYNLAVVGTPCEDGKMKGVSKSFYDWMSTKADFILIEADGSKRLPIKVPNSAEPVIPEDTDLIILVVGLSCLNKTIKEICHRTELATEILNCNIDHKIKPKDIAEIIKSGYCNNINKPIKILLNQSDCAKQEEIMEIVKYLEEYECCTRGYS